jgi:hypothetical protein
LLLHLSQINVSLICCTPLNQRAFRRKRHEGEFERNLIAERTQAGLSAARARGKIGGRPKTLNEDKRKVAIELYNKKELSVKKICEMMSIRKPTLCS